MIIHPVYSSFSEYGSRPTRGIEHHAAKRGAVHTRGRAYDHRVNCLKYSPGVDPSGNVHWTGVTGSADFPIQNAAQPYPGNTGHNNAFIMKFGTFR